MAIDSAQKRMSAINPFSAWRGPMVDATESGFTQGNRQAADFAYSGIAATTPGGVTLMAMERALFRRTFGRVFGRVN